MTEMRRVLTVRGESLDAPVKGRKRMIASDFFLRRVQSALRKALSPILSEMECHARVAAESAQQAELWIKYRTLPPDALRRLSLRDVGFKAYSQSDEDGILLYLLALIGEPLHRSVEIARVTGANATLRISLSATIGTA